MKFYLSSYKIGNEGEMLKQMVLGKMGYIPNARDFTKADPERNREVTKRDMGELQSLGMEVEVLDLRIYFGKPDELRKKIDTLGGVWVSGGNTFVLRQAMKISGFDTILLELIKKVLEDEHMANTVVLDEKERPLVAQLNLLTMKPILYALNISEASENVSWQAPGLSVQIDPVFEKGLDELIKKSYELLGLQTFFTTGEDESRAWTTKIGATAPQAGASIHTDFQNKFIRAQVISCEDLLASGSLGNARAKGLLRTEGKDYIVKDGDVIEFLV